MPSLPDNRKSNLVTASNLTSNKNENAPEGDALRERCPFGTFMALPRGCARGL